MEQGKKLEMIIEMAGHLRGKRTSEDIKELAAFLRAGGKIKGDRHRKRLADSYNKKLVNTHNALIKSTPDLNGAISLYTYISPQHNRHAATVARKVIEGNLDIKTTAAQYGIHSSILKHSVIMLIKLEDIANRWSKL